MRIKKLLLAGALVLTAFGCASAYTAYASTLNNDAKQENVPEEPTTEGKEVKKVDDKKAKNQPDNKKDKKDELVDEDNEENSGDNDTSNVNTPDNSEKDEEDTNELDDEEMDKCDHVWGDRSYAYDPEKGYVITESCEKCSLVRDTPITMEEYDKHCEEEHQDQLEEESNDDESTKDIEETIVDDSSTGNDTAEETLTTEE